MNNLNWRRFELPEIQLAAPLQLASATTTSAATPSGAQRRPPTGDSIDDGRLQSAPRRGETMEIRVRSKMPLPESIDAEVIESANSTLGALAKTIDHVTVTLGGTNAGGSVRSEVRCRLKTQHEPIVADARAAEPEMAVYRALKKARRILSRRLSKERTRRQRHVLVRGGPALA